MLSSFLPVRLSPLSSSFHQIATLLLCFLHFFVSFFDFMTTCFHCLSHWLTLFQLRCEHNFSQLTVKENIYKSTFKFFSAGNKPQNVIENRCQAIKLYFIYIIAEGSQLGYIVPVLLHYKCIKNFFELPQNMVRLLIIDICILSGNYEFAIQKTCIILHLPYARPGAHYSTLWVMSKVSHKELWELLPHSRVPV